MRQLYRPPFAMSAFEQRKALTSDRNGRIVLMKSVLDRFCG